MRQQIVDPGHVSVSGQLDRRLRLAGLRLSRSAPFNQAFVLQDVARAPGFHRQFEEWAGDLSGRYIGALAAYARYSGDQPELLHSVAHAIPGYQRATGLVGSDLPAEHVDYPVIWGQGRLLSGLLEYHSCFPSDAILACAGRLGDYYAANLAQWRDPNTRAQTDFPYYTQAIQPLVALYHATGRQTYLDTASEIGTVWRTSRAALGSGQHSHATLLTLLGLLELSDSTGDARLLQTVRDTADHISTSMTSHDGAPPEFFRWSARTEGCSIADWLELNLRLGLTTGEARYFDVAERVRRNALDGNQGANGGFGHRHFSADRRGYTGEGVEAWWCCSCHGLRGYCRLLAYLYTCVDDEVTVQFFEPSTVELLLPQGRIRIAQETAYPGRGEVTLRILEAPASGIRPRLRLPSWASHSRVALNGLPVDHTIDAGYLRLAQPVVTGDRVELSFPVGLRVESGDDSHARIWHGPLLMTPQMPGGGAYALAVPPADADGLIHLPPLASAGTDFSDPETEYAVIGTGYPVTPSIDSLALNQPQFGRLRPLAAQTGFGSPPPAVLEPPIVVAETAMLRAELTGLLGGHD